MRLDFFGELFIHSVSGDRFRGDGVYVSEQMAICYMRRFSGAEGRQEVGLPDMDSPVFTQIAFRHTLNEHRSYRTWRRDLNLTFIVAMELNVDQEANSDFMTVSRRPIPDFLVNMPSRELPLARDSRKSFWLDKWESAEGRFPAGGDRMVAHVHDPVWRKLSAFGRPWPTFDFIDGEWVKNYAPRIETITSDEAALIGIRSDGFHPPSPDSVPAPCIYFPRGYFDETLIPEINALRGREVFVINNARLEYQPDLTAQAIDFPPPVYSKRKPRA